MTRYRDSMPADDAHDLITPKRQEATDNQVEQGETLPTKAPAPSKTVPDANSLDASKMRQPTLTAKPSAPFSAPSSAATTASTSTSGPDSNYQGERVVAAFAVSTF